MKMNVKLTLTEDMLGTKPLNPTVFQTFVDQAKEEEKRLEEEKAAKAAVEGRSAEEIERCGTTIFHVVNGQRGIWDYQIKGFFKDAAAATNRMDKELRNNLEKLTAYKTKIDQCIFVFPRFIPIIIGNGSEVSMCERPLLADTPQGRRVSLVRSEAIPAGSYLEIEILILSKELCPYVDFWLGYGKLRGLGQWRNSGKGRFAFELKPD